MVYFLKSFFFFLKKSVYFISFLKKLFFIFFSFILKAFIFLKAFILLAFLKKLFLIYFFRHQGREGERKRTSMCEQ